MDGQKRGFMRMKVGVGLRRVSLVREDKPVLPRLRANVESRHEAERRVDARVRGESRLADSRMSRPESLWTQCEARGG